MLTTEMHYKDIYADEEFEEKFTEALAKAAALLQKFFSVAAGGPAAFRDMTERVTRFSFATWRKSGAQETTFWLST